MYVWTEYIRADTYGIRMDGCAVRTDGCVVHTDGCGMCADGCRICTDGYSHLRKRSQFIHAVIFKGCYSFFKSQTLKRPLSSTSSSSICLTTLPPSSWFRYPNKLLLLWIIEKILLLPCFITVNILDAIPIVQIPTFTLHVIHSIFLINIFCPTTNFLPSQSPLYFMKKKVRGLDMSLPFFSQAGLS